MKRRSAFDLPLRSSVISVVGLFLFFCLASMFGCTGGEPKHVSWKNATGAEQHERLMWQAIRDKDWKEFEYRLSPTFVGVTETGQALDRAGWMEHWKTVQIREFSFAEVLVQPNGPDMTVSYLLHLSRATNADLQVISVWQQVKRGWILSSSSTTPVASH